MRIAKLESITYDPHSQSISFNGLNPLSRRKQATISIADCQSFIAVLQDMVAGQNASYVTYAELPNSGQS